MQLVQSTRNARSQYPIIKNFTGLKLVTSSLLFSIIKLNKSHFLSQCVINDAGGYLHLHRVYENEGEN